MYVSARVIVCICIKYQFNLCSHLAKLKQYLKIKKTAAVRRYFSFLLLSASRTSSKLQSLDENVASFVVVAVVTARLLPQHFAPLHKLFLLLVQEQRLHAG